MAENTYVDQSIDRIRNIHHGNFFDYLSSAYEVLRKIFSYLPIDDLETISKTCEKWAPVVETTIKERSYIESFVFIDEFQTCEIWSEASFCIAFCNEESDELKRNIYKHLSKNAQFIIVQSRAGVIGIPSDFTRLVHRKVSKYVSPSAKIPLASYLRIPSYPGVGIKTMVWNRNISFLDFRKSFSLPENQIVKCLLMLITVQDNNEESCEQKDDFVLYLHSIQKESFAVGGCLIDLFLGHSDEKPDAVTTYIIFYGDKVEAASIVLQQDVSTKEKIGVKVQELKLMCPKTEKGVLFVFRCCSRSRIARLIKVKKNIIRWEDNALMKCFPTTPIIGCRGYGEFGRRFPDEIDSELSPKRGRQSDIWEYSFSTSLVYVGFKV